MAGVDHESKIERARIDELRENRKQAKRIDRPRGEIVVAVTRIVEVEAPEAAGHRQTAHDLLDVRVRQVVAEIHEDTRALAGALRQQQRRPPVVDDGRVEGRLVRLVLAEQDPVGRQAAELTKRYVTGPYTFRTLAGIGHWIPEQAPREVAELIRWHLVAA